VLFVVYPMRWFQKILNSLHIDRQRFSIFINCYQGYYKDGTNGTKDYRYFSVLFFVVQGCLFGMYALSKSMYCFPVAGMSTLILLFATLAIQPYKEQFRLFCIIDSFMLFISVCLFFLAAASDEADIKAPYFSSATYVMIVFIVVTPGIYLFTLVAWRVFFKKKIISRCWKILSHSRKVLVVEIPESAQNCDFPDRIVRPGEYTNESSPLINRS